MKAVLVALNAQYIHTNLAVRSIAAFCAAHGTKPHLAEFTINQPFEFILRRLALENADVYQFSCYIWNIEMVRGLAAELRKLHPNALLLAGGPQVSYHCDAFLAQNPAFNGVLAGEGEQASLAVYNALQNGHSLRGLPGLWLQGEAAPPPAAAVDMDTLSFPYPQPEAFSGRIVYYESSRGCPFRCSYCLSAAGQGVRFKSLAKVQNELMLLLAARPHQVKFTDRTFNCSKAHAMGIWQFLKENDNGVTNFHFELHAETLDDEQIAFLATVRKGLFQFEIGVQSTNPATLEAIQRTKNTSLLFRRVAQLQKPGNIHLHLDLIAGLPFEDYTRFAQSFNEVYAQHPHQLQLGFLKVLAGSPLEARAEEYGLAYTNAPPFEILYNKWIRFEELASLKSLETVLELYYNSGRFSHCVAELCHGFASPFVFYMALAKHYTAEGCEDAPPGKQRQYELLGSFAATRGAGPSERLQWLCRLDMALHEKPKRNPGWVTVDGSRPYRTEVLAFYAAKGAEYLPEYEGCDAKQLLKQAHIEVFPFHPFTGQLGQTALLFNYAHRDVTGMAHSEVVQL